MDIYSFLRSPDVAAHCRSINKTWNTLEMAVIISRSNRTVHEKHAAWQALINHYPDMPAMPNWQRVQFGSTHDKLAEIIEYECQILGRFAQAEPGAVYTYKVWWRDEYVASDSVFLSYEAALQNAHETWEKEDAAAIVMRKLLVEDGGSEKGQIEVRLDYEGNYYDVDARGNDETLAKWFPHSACKETGDFVLCGMFYVDIPVPFQRGDILTEHNQWRNSVFVLDTLARNNQKWFEKALLGEAGDGSDLTGWGYYVSENGVLYGDHVLEHDGFAYYKGKLENNERLLHYVSLFIKDEISLPVLLAMQGRIMAEKLLHDDLRVDAHGIYLEERLLAENRAESK